MINTYISIKGKPRGKQRGPFAIFVVLFNIRALEIWQLRETHDSISGIAIGQMYYLALYADDIIGFSQKYQVDREN